MLVQTWEILWTSLLQAVSVQILRQEAIFYSKLSVLRRSPPLPPFVTVSAVTRPSLEENDSVASQRFRAVGISFCAQAAAIVHAIDEQRMKIHICVRNANPITSCWS